MRTAIIGGGIAGLAAAWELEKSGSPWTLFEASPRLGGVISSSIVDGTVLEEGPDSFLTEKPAAAELCRELGLGSDLIGSNDAARKTLILVGKRLVPLPDGLMFLVPTKLIPTALSPLFSLSTKIRMGLELLQPPAPSEADESVAALVSRHYGPEVVDRLAGPLLSGIYGGEANQLSVRAVLPRLVEMETHFGSLTRAMLAARRNARPAGAESKRSTFTTLRGGLQQMIDALTAKLNPASIRSATPVTALTRTTAGWSLTHSGSSEDFDAIILALPTWAAAQLIADTDQPLATALNGIPYSSSIIVNLLYDEAQLGALPPGFGFLVPASAGHSMLACTFVHRKFLGRTAPGKAVLRAFLGGVRNAALLSEPDSTLITIAQRELAEILGPKVIPAGTQPELARITRWPRAMAQYAVGHPQRVAEIRTRTAQHPNLYLAGNAYDGIGISDCIRLGRKAAQQIIAAKS